MYHYKTYPNTISSSVEANGIKDKVYFLIYSVSVYAVLKNIPLTRHMFRA